MIAQIQPEPVAAERALVVAVLTAGDIALADGVQLEAISSSQLREILRAAREVTARGMALDMQSLVVRLREAGRLDAAGGVKLLAELVEGTTFTSPGNAARSAPEYARSVGREHLRSLLEREAAAIAREARAAEEPSDVARAALSRLAGLMTRDTRSAPMEAASDVAAGVWRELEEQARSGRPPGIATGLFALDERALVRPGTLTVVGARTTVGKTAVLGSIALNAARAGHRSMFVELEMPRREIAERMVANLGSIDSTILRDPGRMTADDWQRADGGFRSLSELPLDLWAPGRVTVDEIRANAMRRHADAGVELVIVDYLQLAARAGKESLVERVAEVSAGLKQLALQLGVAVLAAAQLNRSQAREDRAPRLSDLRDSGAIEQDADAVLLLDRPGLHDERVGLDQLDGWIAKNRGGSIGRTRLRIDLPHQRVEDA